MSPSVKAVFEKWIDGDSILEAVLKRRGVFYDEVKERLLHNEATDVDHTYNMESDISFADFSRKVTDDDFHIEDYMKSFRPASVDPERLFSLCRYSKIIRNADLKRTTTVVMFLSIKTNGFYICPKFVNIKLRIKHVLMRNTLPKRRSILKLALS